MNARISNKKFLLGELDRLASLPGNWDERGGSPASPRATGNYKAFLDLVVEPKRAYIPRLESDGGIRVQWNSRVGGRSGDAVVVFHPSGGMYLGFSGHGNDFPNVDRNRLREFVYTAG